MISNHLFCYSIWPMRSYETTSFFVKSPNILSFKISVWMLEVLWWLMSPLLLCPLINHKKWIHNHQWWKQVCFKAIANQQFISIYLDTYRMQHIRIVMTPICVVSLVLCLLMTWCYNNSRHSDDLVWVLNMCRTNHINSLVPGRGDKLYQQYTFDIQYKE